MVDTDMGDSTEAQKNGVQLRVLLPTSSEVRSNLAQISWDVTCR